MGNKRRVIIIGGGASGLIAAIVAARAGSEVILLEQLQRVGKKILATGNGRCNLTNAFIKSERYHGEEVSFINSALSEIDLRKTLDFFEELGISCREEEEGKIYPFSSQASSILDVLRYELKRLNIEERCQAEVIKIIPTKYGINLTIRDGSVLKGDSIVIATGGRSNANLGSTGAGYKLAMNLGHKLIEPFPALVQIRLNFQHLKGLSGVKFIGKATVVGDNGKTQAENGEILFTEYGISGPPILQLSRIASENFKNGRSSKLTIDMFPEFSYEEIIKILIKKIDLDKEKPLDFCLVGLLNKKLIPIILKCCGIIDIHKLCGEMNGREIESIAYILKQWEFDISGTQPWKDSQVTAGGIAVRDINSKTMESKIVKGLYFSGEVMDIDGDCGGFNLQWAWSTGYIAGINASRG